jgi:hypothetical protein
MASRRARDVELLGELAFDDHAATGQIIYGHFRPRRHLLTALSYRMTRALAFKVWLEETCARNAA